MQIEFWNDRKTMRQPLVVKRTDTIGSLMNMIRRRLRLSPRLTELAMLLIDPRDLEGSPNRLYTLTDGRDLLSSSSPTTTIVDSGIRNGDILRVGFDEPFLIQIRSPVYGSVEGEIKVSCHNTIRDLKEKIQKKTGKEIKIGEFPQEFLCEGANDRTLLSYGIFKYVPHPYFQHIFYRNRLNEKPPYGRRVFRRRPPPTPDQGEDEKLQIVVEFPELPWRFPLMCNPTDTIGTMREAIIRKHKLYVQLLHLPYLKKRLFVLVHGGSPLEDDSRTLKECGIKSVEVFEDASPQIAISATPGCIGIKSLSVHMKCFEKIGKLKENLQDATGISIKEQHLFYKGWQLEDSERRLVDYGISKPVAYRNPYVFDGFNVKKITFWGPSSDEEFCIAVLASSDESAKAPEEDHGPSTKVLGRECLQITVEIANTAWRFPLTLRTADTIDTVRVCIADQCPFDRYPYITEGMFELFFGTKQLKDDFNTLGEYGIQDMDFIHLFDNASFDIRVLGHENTLSTSAKVTCYQTVGMLKGQLEVITGIPKEKQHIKYMEVFIEWFLDEDERHLLDYGIAKQFKGSDGLLVPRDPKIIVGVSRSRLIDNREII